MTAARSHSEESLRILIVDDHPLVREALGTLLRQLGPCVEVLEAASLTAAASCVTANPVLSLVILDLTLPDATGIIAVEQLLRDWPDLPVIVLSAKDDPATARAVLDAGARGFISKRSPTRVLTEALRLVVVGGTYVPPQALQEDTPVARDDPPPEGDALAFAAHKSLGLTPRQLDVLALLVQGKPSKLICRALQMAEGTLKTHIAAIYRALHVENRTQAVLALNRLGLTALLARPVPACAAPTEATGELPAAPSSPSFWNRVLGTAAS